MNCLIVASVASMIYLFNKPNILMLQEMGYHVTVAANFSFGNAFDEETAKKFFKELEESGVEVHNILFVRNPFRTKNILAYKQLKKLIDENHYSIIHCHTPIGGVLTRLAAHRSIHKDSTKVIYTAHGFHFFKGSPVINWILYYPVEKWLSKYTDVLITINKEDYAVAKTFHAKKCYYIPGVGIDTKRIHECYADNLSERAKFNIPADAIIVISVGELSTRKNHQAIIKAMKKIENASVYYLICGYGIKENYLKNLCSSLNLTERVKFLGYRSDIYQLLKISDIFAFPSTQEGLPVALMEAMSAGLPCVVSKIRGNTDLIDDNRFVFDCNDIESFADAITVLSENNELRKKLGEENSVKIKNFDIGIISSQMKEIYQEQV